MRSTISKRNLILILLALAISFQVAHSWVDYNVSEYQLNAMNNRRNNKGAKNMKEIHQDGKDYYDDPLPGEYQCQSQLGNQSINTNGGGYYYEASTGYAYIRYQLPGDKTEVLTESMYITMMTTIDTAVTYNYGTKSCASGDDANKCKQFLTLNWHSVEAAYCMDSGLGNQFTPNLDHTYIVCAFKNAPHPTNDMGVNNPWLSGTACTDCPSNYNKCRNDLCSNIYTDPDTGVWDKFLYCEYKVTLEYECTFAPELYIFDNGCPATCGNKNLLDCYDTSYGIACELAIQQNTCYIHHQQCPKTCGICSEKLNAITQGDRDDLVQLINFYRASYDIQAIGMRSVTWDDDLEQVALRIASDCQTNLVSNGTKYRLNKYGFDGLLTEILFNDTRSISGSHSFSLAVEEKILDAWAYYQYDQTCLEGYYEYCRDLTSLLFANTTKFACARYLCDSGSNRYCYSCVFGVANDYPTHQLYEHFNSSIDYPTCVSCPSGTICANNLCVPNASLHFPTKNGTTCSDTDSRCPQWAWVDGFCYSYPGFYVEKCPKSCNVCPGESNSDDWCEYDGQPDKVYNCSQVLTQFYGQCNDQWFYYMCPSLCAEENFHKCKN